MILSRKMKSTYSATVKKYQGYLNRHNQDTRFRLVEDGYYGELTKTATKLLQRVHFPNQPWEWDGVIGPKTADLIDRLNASWLRKRREAMGQQKTLYMHTDERLHDGSWKTGNRKDRFILHHTAGMADIFQDGRYHMEGHDWPGLSYHVWIHQNGTIYFVNEFEKITWHAKGRNSSSIGVALQGNDSITPAQKKAVKWLSENYNIPWAAHRDVGKTVCPGFNTYKWLEQQSFYSK
jgi:hypothetical protein